MSLEQELHERAHGACELCGNQGSLHAFVLPFAPTDDAEGAAGLCDWCNADASTTTPLTDPRYTCLQSAVWSEIAPVQVLAWRFLHRMNDTWAVDLREQVWLDDTVRAWAELGLQADDDAVVVLDSNGTRLAEGDSVTLIKDLDVKGAGFTAKRGTMVKNIHLIDDPTHIEGRVNGMAIYLKTEFLKKA